MRVQTTLLLTLSVVLSFAQSIYATTFYASPTGSSSGDGSLQRPWDLLTALSKHSPLGSGDELHLLAGEYENGTLPFNSKVSGSASSPVVVRPQPGADIVIYGGFAIYEGDVVFRDLHVTSRDPLRQTSQTGPWPQDVRMSEGFSVYAPRVKIINNRIHDVRIGVASWRTAPDTLIYGNIIYYTGWLAPDRPHGNAFYVQNETGTKLIKDNVLFNSFRHGLQAFGTSATALSGIQLEGNFAFNNGSLAFRGDFSRNYLLGGGVPAKDPVFRSNVSYFPLSGNQTGDNNIGYWPNGVGCSGLVFEDNYFVSPGKALVLHNCNPQRMTGNTVVGPTLGFTPGAYPQNTYMSASNPPSGVRVVIRPNDHEPGRAHIAVLNLGGASSVNVDLSAAGLRPGDSYEIYNVQNFEFGKQSGVYGGGTVAVSMTDNTVGQPRNWPTPPSTLPEFGVFLVRKTGQTVAPPPPADTKAPTVSIVSPNTGNTVSGSVQLQASAADDTGVTEVEFLVDGVRVGSPDTSAPFAVTWDSNGASDGSHTVSAMARDQAGNVGQANLVAVTVSNAAPPPPPPDPEPNPEPTPNPNPNPGPSSETYLEAESGAVASLTKRTPDRGASGGLSIRFPAANLGQLTLSFTAGAGQHYFWGRARTPAPSSEEIHVSIDGGPEQVWRTTNGGTDWQWTRISRLDGAPITANLGAGDHTIVFRGRERNVYLDVIAVTTDPSFLPDGATNSGGNTTPPPPPPTPSDTTPPTVLSSAPSGSVSTPDVTIAVTTNEPASCRCAPTPGVSFSAMPQAFDVTGQTNHSELIAGLSPGNHAFYVRCQDAAGNTASSDHTVSFTVVQPSSNLVEISMEAENAKRTHPLKRQADGQASGGRFIRFPSAEIGTLTFDFDLAGHGVYYVWGRARTPYPNADELYASIDGGAEQVWRTTDPNVSGWQWTLLRRLDGSAITPTLSGGRHALTFRGKERNVYLDAVVVTNDPNFDPSR